MLNRLAMLEFFCFWRGGCSARELGQLLGLTREQVQKAVIGPFQEKFGQHAQYDRSLRRVVIQSDAGGLKLAPSRVSDALNLLSAMQSFARAEGYLAPSIDGWVEVEDLLQPLENERETEAFRAIYAAASAQRALILTYRAKSSEFIMQFSPHAVVRTHVRPHFRGYARYAAGSNNSFIDLVPGRVVQIHSAPPGEYVGNGEDGDWHRRVTIVAKQNGDLPSTVAASLRQEFGTEYQLTIPDVRLATAPYLQQWLKTRRVQGLSVPLWSEVLISAP